MQFIPLIFILLLFLFMRKQQQSRVRAQETLVSSLVAGDEVVTTSGLHGLVQSTDAQTVSLLVAEDVVVRFAKGAIARKTQGLVPEVPQ